MDFKLWTFVVCILILSLLLLLIGITFSKKAFIKIKKLLIDRNYISIKRQMALRIAEATKELSNQKLGALIVIEKNGGLDSYINLGVLINANVNVQLILSIFNKKSPLHDGAIIIRDDKIISTSSYFPTTKQKISSKYGSRHRAAIGLSEVSDALPIVVSETTGQISYSSKGNLHAIEDFIDLLNIIYKHIGFQNESKELGNEN